MSSARQANPETRPVAGSVAPNAPSVSRQTRNPLSVKLFHMINALDGKVALVTGGSRGIGAATARKLAEHGADVAFTFYQNQQRADEVVDHIKAIGRRAVAMRVDSADPDAVTEAVDRAAGELGRLDILVNNAGTGVLGPIQELTREQFDHTIAVNVRAPFVAAQAAVRHLPAGGRIINIGSNVAERVVFPGFGLYATSKAAMIGLTKALGRELGARAITVNLVHPGATDTDMNPADGPNAEAQAAHTALGHYAGPADIAATVAFLAGPDARYITGTSITVDGGFNS
jgi:3-oxoacyl-[acyl-carrier protein] reductase